MIICCLCGDRIGDTEIRSILLRVRVNGTEAWEDASAKLLGFEVIGRGLAHSREWVELDRERRGVA